MNISKLDQKLLLILFGLVVFLAAYFGICKSFNNKKADVELQIAALDTQFEELRGYSAKQDYYQGEINRLDPEISDELSAYPADVRSEDMIMYTTQLEDKIGVSIDNISFASPEAVSRFAVPEKSGESSAFVDVVAIHTGLTISCSLNYEQLKKLINYIYASPEKTGVSSVLISYEAETGSLTGTVSMDKYFIISEDYSYTKTDIPSVSMGTDDPFGTFSVTTTTLNEGQTN